MPGGETHDRNIHEPEGFGCYPVWPMKDIAVEARYIR